MKKLTLILADIHHRVDQADKIIRHTRADVVISLGDAFDDFNDDPETVRHTAEWFVDFVNQPNHIYIKGNHCVHYEYDVPHLRCSGYAQWKSFIINDIVSRKDWDKMVWYHILDGKWLLSHGGLHKFHLPPKIAEIHADRPKFLNKLNAYLTTESHKAFRDGSWFTHAGFSRGGSQRVGGITWCDFEREFYPIIGLNQIVGHTPQGLGFPKWCVLKNNQLSYSPSVQWNPKPKDYDNVNASYNIDLDVHMNTHWAIWDEKQLKIFNWNADM